jgi:nucleolar protein 12
VAQPRHLVASQSLRPSDQHSNIIDGQPESGDDEKTFNQVSKSKEALPDSFSQQAPRKKRKHAAEDDIEGAYMQRLAREQEQDDARRKRAKQGDDSTTTLDGDEDAAAAGSSTDADSALDGDEFVVPQHESLSAGKPVTELDKAGRTVFLGNVSTDCIKSKSSKRQLVEYLASFFAELPESKTKHEVESLRFRSTAYSTSSVPKKAAFAKKELMDATTHSTNAYAVYSTALAAREAVKKLNATIVLGRHLRVDSVAHPAKIDHRRCVFVGNLGFVDDESNIRSAQEDEDKKAPKKGKVAADVEEGLWRTFGAAGLVESVRVVRDKTTRVGKGFAYVQFTVYLVSFFETQMLMSKGSQFCRKSTHVQ